MEKINETNIFKRIGSNIASFCKEKCLKIGHYFKEKWTIFANMVKHANKYTAMSFAFMGLGQICYKKYAKGIILTGK